MESNFIQAAEKAIENLQLQVNTAAGAAENAKASAYSAAQTATLWKRLTIALSCAVVLLLVLAGFGVSLYMGQRNSTNALRQEAINACMTGNDRAAGTVTALDELVTLLEGSKPTAAVKSKAASYEAFVAQHNAPRNCQQAYSQP